MEAFHGETTAASVLNVVSANLEILANGIKSGVVRWKQRNPDRFVAAIGSQLLSANQIHFYNEDTVSIGCLIVRLRLGAYIMDLWEGTPGMECFRELLALQFSNWSEHLTWMVAKAQREIQSIRGSTSNSRTKNMRLRHSTHTPFISLLTIIRDATIQRRLKWKRLRDSKPARYTTRINGMSYVIEFINPLIQPHVGPPPSIARVTTHGITMDFCGGTEGWKLVEQILSLGNREYEKRLTRLANIAAQAVREVKPMLVRD